MISMICRKQGTSIAYSLIGPSIISLLFTLLDTLSPLKNMIHFSNYSIDTILTNLTSVQCSNSTILQAIFIGCIVMVACLYIGLYLVSKNES